MQDSLRYMGAKTHPVYTYNMDLTESEFLKRELKLQLTKIDMKIEKLLTTESVFAIATCIPSEIESILKKCQPNSAIIFFFGNETYDVPQFMWFNKYKNKIKYSYVYNIPRKTSFLVCFRCLIGAIYDGGLFMWEKDRNIYRNFKNGVDLMRRTRKINLEFKFSDFPQGYSKRFIQELISESLFVGDGSVLENAPIKFQTKTKRISFVGQTGSWCRSLALNTLIKLDKSFSPIYTFGWGGSNQGDQNTYVQEISRSELALNPPGNLTNRTHRYLESLIMNSLPVLPPSSLQDPHLWGVWSENQIPKTYSWKLSIKKSSNFSLKQRLNLINSALEVEKEKINAMNKNLDNLFTASLESQ
jgi:hypothetical protein